MLSWKGIKKCTCSEQFLCEYDMNHQKNSQFERAWGWQRDLNEQWQQIHLNLQQRWQITFLCLVSSYYTRLLTGTVSISQQFSQMWPWPSQIKSQMTIRTLFVAEGSILSRPPTCSAYIPSSFHAFKCLSDTQRLSSLSYCRHLWNRYFCLQTRRLQNPP